MDVLPQDLDPIGADADGMLGLYREAHAQGCPVLHSTAHGGFYLLSSHAAVRAAAADWGTFSSANGVTLPRFPVRNVAIEHDPPEHTYWSGVYREILSPRATRAAEESVRADAIALIDGFAGRGEAELVGDLATIIPGNTICRLLGITDPERVRLGCRLGVELGEGIVDPVKAGPAIAAFTEFVRSEIGSRRAAPRDDFLTRVATEDINGHRLSDDEIQAVCTGFLLAGHHTTTSGMSALFHRIATTPELRDRLAADPSLIPAAAEEAIRLETPLHGFFRTTTREVDVEGTSIPAGSEVWLNYQAGNRDPRVFDDPEEFRADRRPNPHLAFGHGIHTCTGASLARMEMRVVTEELLARIPDLTSTGEAPHHLWGGFNIMRLDRVPVTFTPVAAPATPVTVGGAS